MKISPITINLLALTSVFMTFYGISRARGNATMVITSATTVPLKVENGKLLDGGAGDLLHPA